MLLDTLSAPGVVPVYQTLAPRQILRLGATPYRKCFPFSAQHGRWAFSGRVALHHGLLNLKLPRGSTILVPAYFQGVEIQTLLHDGYKLVFYRLNENFEADLNDVREKCQQHDAAALYLIHYFGFTQPLEEARTICTEFNLRMIEDCALSLFSRRGSEWLGSQADLAIFSVYKTVALPHGGYFTMQKPIRVDMRPAPALSTLAQTQDLLVHHLRASRFHPITDMVRAITPHVRQWLGYSREEAINSGGADWDAQMLPHNASTWTAWLMRAYDPETVINHRRRNYLHLLERLRGHLELPFPELPEGVCPLFMPVMVANKRQFQHALAERGVESVNLWEEHHPACPQALAQEVDGWRRHILELPIHHDLDLKTIDRVADTTLQLIGDDDRAISATSRQRRASS